MSKFNLRDAAEPRKMARFVVSSQLLRKALCMPEGYSIVGAEWDFTTNGICLFAEGPEFPEVRLGEVVPRISPIVTSCVDPYGRFNVGWGWGI